MSVRLTVSCSTLQRRHCTGRPLSWIPWLELTAYCSFIWSFIYCHAGHCLAHGPRVGNQCPRPSLRILCLSVLELWCLPLATSDIVLAATARVQYHTTNVNRQIVPTHLKTLLCICLLFTLQLIWLYGQDQVICQNSAWPLVKGDTAPNHIFCE